MNDLGPTLQHLYHLLVKAFQAKVNVIKRVKVGLYQIRSLQIINTTIIMSQDNEINKIFEDSMDRSHRPNMT